MRHLRSTTAGFWGDLESTGLLAAGVQAASGDVGLGRGRLPLQLHPVPFHLRAFSPFYHPYCYYFLVLLLTPSLLLLLP